MRGEHVDVARSVTSAGAPNEWRSTNLSETGRAGLKPILLVESFLGSMKLPLRRRIRRRRLLLHHIDRQSSQLHPRLALPPGPLLRTHKGNSHRDSNNHHGHDDPDRNLGPFPEPLRRGGGAADGRSVLGMLAGFLDRRKNGVAVKVRARGDVDRGEIGELGGVDSTIQIAWRD